MLIASRILVIGDGYRAKNAELRDVGLPFLRAANIDGRLNLEDVDRLGWEGVRHAGEKISKAGDVVFTSKGTVGRFAFVSDKTPPFVYSPQLSFWRVVDRSRLDPRFLFYWLQGSEARSQLHALKGQTDMADYVSLRDQRTMEITLPSLDEQRRIAGVLGALDDKIELNRRMSETLEAMARALFSKTLSGNTNVVPLRDLVELKYGKALRETDRRPGHVEVFGSNGRVGTHDEALVPGPGIVIGRKGHPGSVHWAHTDFYPIDTTFYVVSKPDAPSLLWLFHALSTVDFTPLSTDSAVPGLNRRLALDVLIPVAPRDAITEFDSMAKPLRDLQHRLEVESRMLGEIRDALLPKLVSGQIRVPESYEP